MNLSAWAFMFGAWYAVSNISTPEPPTIDLKAGEKIDFRIELSRGGALKLTAVDQDGKPVPGAIAGLADAEGEPVPFWLTRGASARTDNQGRLEMVGIAPGTYDLSLLLSGEIVEKRRVEIPEGDPVEVAITIER